MAKPFAVQCQKHYSQVSWKLLFQMLINYKQSKTKWEREVIFHDNKTRIIIRVTVHQTVSFLPHKKYTSDLYHSWFYLKTVIHTPQAVFYLLLVLQKVILTRIEQRQDLIQDVNHCSQMPRLDQNSQQGDAFCTELLDAMERDKGNEHARWPVQKMMFFQRAISLLATQMISGLQHIFVEPNLA